MAKLTSKQRKALPKSEFALPSEGKYPINDKAHARNALARVSQQLNKGNISPGAAAEVRAKAKRKLGESGESTGKTHGKPKRGTRMAPDGAPW